MLRNTLVLVVLICSQITFGQNNQKNISEVFHWASPDTNVNLYNDCWGYTDSTGREYAVIGSNWGTHILEVTSDSTEPRLIAEFIGRADNVTWRDFKTYSHYLYGVADGDSNSLQIFDLQFLPDSVVKVFDDNSVSQSSHNIFIDGDRLYFCSNQIGKNKSNHSLDVYSLQTPEDPTHLESFNDSVFGYYLLHDIQVVDNIAYCSAGYGGLHVYDLNDLSNPVLLALIDIYPEQGYNHSSWLNDDKTKLVVADEVPAGLALKLFEVSDPSNIELLDIFHSHDLATPHNPFFANDLIMVSYYLDGVQVFDYSNPFKVRTVANFDTYPDNTNYVDFGSYNGCWGVYPFLPSKNVIASDRKYGLYVLDIDENSITALSENVETAPELMVSPSPVNAGPINVISNENFTKYWIYNNLGYIVKANEGYFGNSLRIIVDDLSNGNYIIVTENDYHQFQKVRFIKE